MSKKDKEVKKDKEKKDKWWKKGYYYWDDIYSSGGSSWGGSYYRGYSSYDEDDAVSYGKGTSYTPRYKSSLGWSSGRLFDTTTSSSSYTSYSYKSGEEVNELAEILTQAYRTARDMVVILDFPFNVRLDFSQHTISSYVPGPDTKSIFVPTLIFEASDKERQDKINIFCGLAVHEAAHLKYTSYLTLQSFLSKIKSSPETIDSHLTGKTIPFLLALVNMLEDERIEDCLLKERPGYIDFIALQKKWNYDNFIAADKSTKKDVDSFLNNLYRLVRFPDEIEDDIIEKYSAQYERIRNIVTPLPDSTKEVCSMALKVFIEIFKIFDELGIPEAEVKDSMQKQGTAAGNAFVVCTCGHDSSSSISSEHLNKYTSKQISSDSIISNLVTGAAEKGSKKDSFLTSEKGDAARYNDCVRRVQKYIPSIRKLVKGHDRNYDFNIYGCRSGLLDTDKLAEAYQGVPQVYIRQGQVRTNKTTVCVLIDESGSMRWGDDYGEITCESVARDAAVLLNESLKGLDGVDLYIYGHSADQLYSGSTELYIYREGNKTRDPYSLSNVQGRCENRDGTAIFEAAKRVRKFTQGHCIMFVLSDGEPAANGYYGLMSRKDVRSNVTKVQQMDFDVIQVSINYVGHVSEMFDKYISLEYDLANFPKKLAQVIKKAIVNDKKTTIS